MQTFEFPERFFITGTDTDIGKTVVSAILMAGLNAAYWKPIQSGQDGMTDTDWMRSVTGFSDESFIPETYLLSQPLSPHASAEYDRRRIELSAFNLPDNEKYPRLIVEGAGGVMVPLNKNQLMIDLMKYLDLPVLLVARSAIGTINHTLLSIDVLRRKGLEVLGVVMNGLKNQINKEAIESFGRVHVIAQVDNLPMINFDILKNAYIRYFNE
ncbi:MAG: dethiobiotin synthase [Desulfobacteraceae bacterium]|nr:dethiobiotin synthase [Desulfobacteraceae bacterium]